ncbi:dihydrodipicolinate synthase family protein [Neokomagataea thailandica]|uniref:Dihydrodipicolinate synthetase n=1 Tax=Neokomagataea tanensis NBRC 106556 TaxID=1223519 RepID=A0ABQ0QJD1_9PROT|nr:MULTISPECIES: dihydrodipicolinate synthase family protein [Neokomagataea]GBR46897.1 dihydrodipicolinate synthetase [Neokomagataea tanensis NBRC 106556]
MSIFNGLSAFPITPTNEQGIVDTDGVSRLSAHLSSHGVHSIGLLGSTGGYAYLNRTERRRAVHAAATILKGRTPLIVGIGALRTDDAQNLARDAAEEGADGLLLAPMSYAPLTEEEVYQHYAAVAKTTSLPLCVYNNPGTTHFTFQHTLLERLADIPTIAALKMPTPMKENIAQELAHLKQSATGRLTIGYSRDWLAPEALLAGADGWFSVLGGFLPQVALALTTAAQAGNSRSVEQYQRYLAPIWALFQKHGSLKIAYAAANILGLTHAQPPLPILPLPQQDRQNLTHALQNVAIFHDSVSKS